MDKCLLGGKVIFLKKNGINRKIYNVHGTSVLFGKDLKCQFRLRNPSAKRIHCKIVMGKIGRVQIVNFSEKEHVLVNGEAVPKKKYLKSGDTLDVLGLQFVWEYVPNPEVLKAQRRSCPTKEVQSPVVKKRRVCKSEPGRKTKFMWLSEEATVTILAPLGKSRKSEKKPTEELVPELMELPKTPETGSLDVTVVSSSQPPRESINLIDLQTPGPSRGHPQLQQSINLIDLETPGPSKVNLSASESTLVAGTTIDMSKSLYGTPIGASTTTVEKDFPPSETPDIFKTPMRQTRTNRGVKTPSSATCRTAVKVEFTSLPQSTPIDAAKCLNLTGESTIIDVDQSETVITIDDSSETMKTPENSVKFIENPAQVDESLVTPKRILRSAIKPSAVSSKKLQEVTQKTPRTPRSANKSTKTPQSVASMRKLQEVTPRSSRLTQSARKSTKTPQSVKKDQEDFSTPKNTTKLTKRPATSARKPRARKVQERLNTSDTTGDKAPPTVSQLRGLMTMDNLANITSEEDEVDKENITTPTLEKSAVKEDSHLKSTQKMSKTPDVTPLTEKSKQWSSLSAIKSGRVSKTPRSPLNNLSNFSGVKNLYETQLKSPLKELQKKQIVAFSPLNDLTDVGGVRRLFRTPGRGKKDDLTDVVGVRELLRTPKSSNKLEDIVGVRELMKTPPEETSMNLRGVRDLMRELPEDEASIRLAGIKDLMKEPVTAETSVNYVGVKELMKEAKEADESVRYAGIKELMRESAGDKTINYAGLRDLMKPSTSKDTSFAVVGVRELLKEPEDIEVSQNLTGMVDLFTVPEEAKPTADEASRPTSSSSSVVEVVNLDVTPDELFDSLKGTPSIPSVQRTYSRKDSPKKSPKKEEKGSEEKGIQEWIDSIVLSTTNDTAHSRRANNTLQVLSDKYSNVTATESEQLLIDTIDDTEEASEVINDTSAVRKEPTGRDTSLRKLAIAQSFAESEKNLLSVNDTFDLAHGVTSTPKAPNKRVDLLAEISPRRSPRILNRQTPDTAQNNEVSSSIPEEKPRRGRKPKVTFAVPDSPAIVEEPDRAVEAVEGKKKTLRKAKSDDKAAAETVSRPKRTRKATESTEETAPETKTHRARRGRKVAEEKQELDEVEVPAAPVRAKRGRKAAVKNDDDKQDTSSDVFATPAKPRAKRGRKPKTVVEDKEEAAKPAEQDIAESSSGSTRAKRSRKAAVEVQKEQEAESPVKPRTTRNRKAAVEKNNASTDSVASVPTTRTRRAAQKEKTSDESTSSQRNTRKRAAKTEEDQETSKTAPEASDLKEKKSDESSSSQRTKNPRKRAVKSKEEDPEEAKPTEGATDVSAPKRTRNVSSASSGDITPVAAEIKPRSRRGKKVDTPVVEELPMRRNLRSRKGTQ